MNEFLMRAIKVIKSQTGCTDLECKQAFDKTHSIKASIDFLRWLNYKKYDGQVI